MASRNIATILSLRDNMSRGLIRASKNVKNMDKQTQRATKRVANFANKSIKNFERVGDRTAKMAGVMATVVAGLATKVGFGEAFNMEGYKVQLETATKNTKKASKLMANAVRFANKTPFETGAVVEATATMETYGLSSKRWLKDVANMAGSTNKSISQATEAMTDIAVGEFERIKEFGLRKDMILAESNKKYGEGVIFNSKGQVIDQIKLMDVVQSMMQKKFKGGAKALSETSRGMWSTITGITKSSLAKILGMQENGTIKASSALDKLKGKIQNVADTLQRWQEDGTMDKIADKASEVFDKVYNSIEKVIKYVEDNKDEIKFFGEAFLILYGAIKVIKLVEGALKLAELASLAFSGTLSLTPVGWITAIVGGLVLIATHWDTVKEKAAKFYKWLEDHDANGFFKSVREGGYETRGSRGGSLGKAADARGETGIDPNRLDNKVNNSGVPNKIAKYAKGGIATEASIFGEAGPEIAIPLKKTPRSLSLLDQANNILGSKGNGTTVNNYTNQQPIIVNFHSPIYGDDNLKNTILKTVHDAVNNNKPNLA
ncbi:hypothetical protein [Tepidibacter mesophilus]|uniref:hypothetical protein n=1 Tax=Tepidibacter mesophilus TaxID=655607 RepID=UPI000C07CF38|nr:hypothetical protein [Tepidibacter mesophilus]